MKYKAVIFDLDGTLVDSRYDIAMAANKVLQVEGYPTWPIEQYGLFMGNGLRNLVKYALLPVTGKDAEIDRCYELVRKEYHKNFAVKTKPYPGIKDLLDFLAENGLQTAIVTNKPHNTTCMIVLKLLGDYEFSVVQGSEQGRPLKPDPESVLEVCRRMKVAPEEVLYVGDSEVDIETARNAAIDCVSVCWGYRTREQLQQAGATRIIERVEELKQICNSPRN